MPLVPIVWAKAVPLTSIVFPLDFNDCYLFLQEKEKSNFMLHDAYKRENNYQWGITTKSKRMWIQCQNLRDLKVLNWLAADFFVKSLGNVSMLKNGTATENCWSLLRAFGTLIFPWIPGFLNLCLLKKLFIILKLYQTDLHESLYICHTGLDNTHVMPQTNWFLSSKMSSVS